MMDRQQRIAAIRPDASFLVQAPAGSGKTSLLTQRYLRLLATVDEPEEILAITFTRKAAAEMRARILGELRDAECGAPVESEYRHETRRLALAALERDRAREWQVLSSPQRLRIQTIDSFEASLVSRLPVLSRLGFSPASTQNAGPLYAAAVREALRSMALGQTRGDLVELLCLYDNNLEAMTASLMTLLATRDQWMPAIGPDPLGEATSAELRAALEEGLRLLIAPDLERLRQSIPWHLGEDLVWLARFAATHWEPDREPVAGLADLSGWPEAHMASLPAWRLLGDWLFTSSGTLRKAVNKNVGFPAGERAAKQRMEAFLGELAEHDAFLQAFAKVRALPEPRYTDPQWRVLEALFRFLREVVPQLYVQFVLRRETDFAEIALRTTDALEAAPGVPTLLAERLDAQIRHLLVDEFQDTSVLQMRLVRQLTENWSQADGRTLFLVGDPMQSIYGWRNARVELFLRAWEGSLSGLPTLETLQLTRNFRSRRGLIETFNAWLGPHFPQANDAGAGAVRYAEALPDADETDPRLNRVQCHGFLDATLQSEAEWIAGEVMRIQRADAAAGVSTRVGVLFRKGANAAVVGAALGARGMRFQAIDVEPLAGLAAIQDLRALWCALESPEDRLAWLSVLRAPWNALTLEELERLGREAADSTLWEWMAHAALPSADWLSNESRLRLRRVALLFTHAMEWRGRMATADLLRLLWEQSGARRYHADARSQMAATQFLRLLGELEQAGLLQGLEALDEALARLFAPPDPEAPDTLQLLTIHKAKGLEFDVVFLPYLNAGRANGDTPPIAWDEVPVENAQDGRTESLVIAPRHATGESRSDIGKLLASRRRAREDYESRRVLYVAMTRAREELHLLATIDPKEAIALEELQPKRDSYLGLLWPHFEDSFAQAWQSRRENPAPRAVSETPYPMLRRMAAEELPALEERARPLEIAAQGMVHLFRPGGSFETPETATGTVFHRMMERIANGRALSQAAEALPRLMPWMREELRSLLPAEPDLDRLARRVADAVAATAHSATGQWIFDGHHREARAEQAIGFHERGEWRTVRVDRMFRDAQGALHVVDFKLVETGAADAAGFLRTQRALYANQVEGYARILQRERGEPVTVTLYFPLQDLHAQWVVPPLTETA